MSADLKVLILSVTRRNGERKYTALALQASEGLFDIGTNTYRVAKQIFDRQPIDFRFSTLGRAKQLAGLIADEYRRLGLLDEEDRLILELDESSERVYLLSMKGKRRSVVDTSDTSWFDEPAHHMRGSLGHRRSETGTRSVTTSADGRHRSVVETLSVTVSGP